MVPTPILIGLGKLAKGIFEAGVDTYKANQAANAKREEESKSKQKLLRDQEINKAEETTRKAHHIDVISQTTAGRFLILSDSDRFITPQKIQDRF